MIKVSNFAVKFMADYKKELKIKNITQKDLLTVLGSFASFKIVYLASRENENFMPSPYEYLMRDIFLHEFSKYDARDIDYKDFNKRIKKAKNCELNFKKVDDDTIDFISEYILPFRKIGKLTFEFIDSLVEELDENISELLKNIEKINGDAQNSVELQKMSNVLENISEFENYDGLDLVDMARRLDLSYDENDGIEI